MVRHVHDQNCRACRSPTGYSGKGRPPVYCVACSRAVRKTGRIARADPAKPPPVPEWEPPIVPPAKRERRAAPSDAPEAQIAKLDRRAKAAHARTLSADVDAVRRLAVALRSYSEPREAARSVGLDLEPDNLAQVYAEAMTDQYQALREGRSSEGVIILTEAMLLGSIRLRAEVLAMPPTSLPAALKAIAQSIELLGGAALQYSNITMTWRVPAGATEDPRSGSG